MRIQGIAHRGYSSKYPENTLSAFQGAIDLSFTHVELDVQLSSDGVAVLMHDYVVDRMTDGTGAVGDLTYAQLRSLKVGGNERIATLEDALELLKGRATVVVELKQAGHLYPGLEVAALEVIYRTSMQDEVIIIGFDHFSMQRVRGLDAQIPIGLTSTSSLPYVMPFMKEHRMSLLGVPLRMLTPEYDRLIVDSGITVGPWVVNLETDMHLIAQRYPHSLVTTDELERWAEVYAQYPELGSS